MFVMAAAITRVVRRSASLMEQNQKSYGTNFTFGEYGLHKTKKLARRASYGLVLGFLIIASPLKGIVRRFLPKPGEGPSEDVQNNGWFRSLRGHSYGTDYEIDRSALNDPSSLSVPVKTRKSINQKLIITNNSL